MISVYNRNFEIIVSKCLKLEYNCLHCCFSRFDKWNTCTKCHVSKLKNQVFFLERNWKSTGKKVKGFFFFPSLEGIYFHDSVIFKSKTKNQQKHVSYKTICKISNPPIKIQIELDWYSAENVFDLCYYYGVKTVGNFFALTVG